jgi:hypothetical protein
VSRERSARGPASTGPEHAGSHTDHHERTPASPLSAVGNQALARDPERGRRACGCHEGTGNLAVQRRLQARGVQPKLTVGGTNDEHEQEADRAAAEIVEKKATPCLACQAEAEPIVRRKSEATASPSATPLPTPDGGQRLDGTTRAEMEDHFARDFGGVRIHTGPEADRSAALIGARAYTLGEDIVFRAGGFRPETSDGKSLLAHELAHVVQQRGAPTLRRRPDLRKQSIGTDFALGLGEMELERQASFLKAYLATPGRYEGEAYTDYLTAKENLTVLEDELRARVLRLGGFGGPGPASVARPPGLPLDEGYTLQELTDLPADVVAQIPEGQLVTLPGGGEEPATNRPSGVWPGLGGGGYAGLGGVNSYLRTFGVAPAGDFAVGLVAIPPSTLNPFSPNRNLTAFEIPGEFYGHTAVYVRQGGKITIVRGYNPMMEGLTNKWNVVANRGEIFSGRMGVPGAITGDANLFESMSVRTIEYPVTADVAARIANELPGLGVPPAGHPPEYTAPPSEYARLFGGDPGCVGTNCGLWAAQQLKTQLRGDVGIAGEPPIVDIPVPGQASQGRIYGMLNRIEAGEPTLPMPGASGPPLAGGLSRGMTVLKWGGRVFVAVGIGKLGYDIITAPEGERGHVAFVGGMGFAGGFAAGAALGLVCGPGAPVCSVITGIVGGIAGGLAGTELGEAIWNLPEHLKGAATTATEIVNELEDRKVQQLVRKSGGTMPAGVQSEVRKLGIGLLLGD